MSTLARSAFTGARYANLLENLVDPRSDLRNKLQVDSPSGSRRLDLSH